jgi:hypothetical protein
MGRRRGPGKGYTMLRRSRCCDSSAADPPGGEQALYVGDALMEEDHRRVRSPDDRVHRRSCTPFHTPGGRYDYT